MEDSRDVDVIMEDNSDEEADSDFDAEEATEDNISSSSGADDDEHQISVTRRARPKAQLKTKVKEQSQGAPLELDSGDEATIREQSRLKQKQKQRDKKDTQDENSDSDEQEWRARTRAMREKDHIKKKRSKLASAKESTIDVDQIWEAMNRPGGMDDLSKPLTAPAMRSKSGPSTEQKENIEPRDAQFSSQGEEKLSDIQKEDGKLNDMVTIEESYEFAGEVHTRKQTVPRASAEAKLWLAQKSHRGSDVRFIGDEPIRRPLRKISRFDPNLNNLDNFKTSWEKSSIVGKGAKIQKLNMVDKSKMDWAAHVNQEGLRDELQEHAKAKGGYLSRMDFLGQVEQRKEEEAKRFRMKG